MFFVRFFLFLFAVSGFVLVKSYCEKKPALITSFILLLAPLDSCFCCFQWTRQHTDFFKYVKPIWDQSSNYGDKQGIDEYEQNTGKTLVEDQHYDLQLYQICQSSASRLLALVQVK